MVWPGAVGGASCRRNGNQAQKGGSLVNHVTTIEGRGPNKNVHGPHFIRVLLNTCTYHIFLHEV